MSAYSLLNGPALVPAVSLASRNGKWFLLKCVFFVDIIPGFEDIGV